MPYATVVTSEPDDVVERLRVAGVGRGALVGVGWSAQGLGLAFEGVTLACPGDGTEVVRRLLAELAPRLLWWSAREVAPLVRAGIVVRSCWDVGASHRLLHGGSERDPSVIWAYARGLDPESRPRTGQLDLLGTSASTEADENLDEPVGADGHLRAGWAEQGPTTPVRAAGWAAAALQVQRLHADALRGRPDPRPAAPAPALPVLTAWSESAAELLAVELGLRGLPVDRSVATMLVQDRVGPRPDDAAGAVTARQIRDAAVLDLVPTAAGTDLRNPLQVRELLLRAGIDVPDTRAWRLEPFRDAHPVVAALISWRQAERISTTYGYAWLDRDLGPDGRLRGLWSGCDGAAGRMTASSGLHNMPAELRPAVVAEPGHLFVRADLGQIEPRVLAAVSGDTAFARAAAEDDLYAPVATRLGVERPVAKIAVLAAMYGQTSGSAGEALRGLERAYPVAMTYLRTAHEAGATGQDVRTYGGRLVRTGTGGAPSDPAIAAARGRFARNAVVQGAAAELFKMWAVSVRAALPPGAAVVLCLHDELLVQVREPDAEEIAALLVQVLGGTARRWSGGDHVRFVADVSVVSRWSDAKG